MIERARTEYAEPIVFATKKDGMLRFWVDYRKLNAETKRDASQIHRMEECICSFGESTVSSNFDVNSGYWQAEIDKPDRGGAVSTSHHELYSFIRTPFGLRNAPAPFSVRWTSYHLQSNGIFALIYLDIVLIFSTQPKEKIAHVHDVLILLTKVSENHKLEKCCFFTDMTAYIGNIIRPKRLEIASYKTDAICGLKYPTNMIELRLFLGFCNDCILFEPNFARFAAPFNKKL